MKPKATVRSADTERMAAGHEDHDEVTLAKAYESVGLLITESRLPEKSGKGRRDGEHIPQNPITHKRCSDENEECQKVHRYKEVMAGLCRNGIPLCVEVLLCPHCEIECAADKTTPNDKTTPIDRPHHHNPHDVGAAHSNSYVLLEQWTIQQVHSRADSKPQPLQNLCNAVRSHLCFSQLSAWLQVSQGVAPRHIFYRLTAPGEWFVHKFVMSPQSHTFPDASLGRSRYALRVTLSSLPRTALTPYEISIASRDKLFAVKDASPSLRHSRSSYSNVADSTHNSLAQPVNRFEPGLSLTPNERTHTRSKSVRGINDITARKSPTDPSSRTFGAQRCLNYSDDTHTNFSLGDSLSAAEKLASFSALPTRSINKLELIQCNAGNTASKTVPPNRLALSSQRCASLKSPKVLFTRTSVYNKDNFFPVPSLDSSTDLTSDLSTDNESDLEHDGAVGRPRFDIGDNGLLDNHCNRLQPDAHLASNLTENLANHKNSSAKTAANQIPSSSVYETSNGTHRPSLDYINSDNLTKYRVNTKSSNDSNGVKNGQDLLSEEKHLNGDVTNDTSTELDSKISKPDNINPIDNNCSRRRKTRRSQTTVRDENNANQSSEIGDTPVNKKLQGIKNTQGHPLSRSRLFKQRPLQSSPAPVKRLGRTSFGYDENINSVKSITNAISCTSLSDTDDKQPNGNHHQSLTLSSSAPAFSSSNKQSHAPSQSHTSLLGNFEESLLNGRIDPAGLVEGFTVDIGASGSFCPKHVSLPVEAYFFNSLSEDDAPSPYLGYVDLSEVSRRGYQIPRKGTLQITLFYPNHKVNKMFVVTYDLMDMPARSQTFIRQKTVYAPCDEQKGTTLNTELVNNRSARSKKLPTYLRYLIHLRFLSTKTNKIFLHTDIRLIYARDKFEFDSRVASYELRSFIESPSNPKYSPLR